MKNYRSDGWLGIVLVLVVVLVLDSGEFDDEDEDEDENDALLPRSIARQKATTNISGF